MRISTEDATLVISTYCIDDPPDGAINRLTSVELPLVEKSTNDWVRIVGEFGMRQDDLDAILYPKTNQ